MPTFSAITVEKIASTNEKHKKRSPIEESGDRPRFASPILYTTPKTTSIPYIARSFTSSPYVINHKRRPPPSAVLVDRIQAKDAVPQNGFLLVDANQECADSQQGKVQKLGDNCEKNDKTLARNGGSLIEKDGNLGICDGKRAIEEVEVREENVVAEKMGICGEFLVKNGERLIEDGEKRLVNDEENMELDDVRVRDECEVAGNLVINGENWINSGGCLFKDVNLVKNDENRGIDDVRVSKQFGAAEKLGTSALNSVNNGEKMVYGDKDGITEKTVNQELSVEIGRFEVVGANSILVEDERRLKPYSFSTEFSPKNTEVYVAVNDNYTPRTNRTDFFDAEDDLFSEDEAGQSTRSFNSRMHTELDSLRSKISNERERRIRAEEALSVYQNVWQESMEKFAAVGSSLPSIEIGACRVEVTTVDVIDDLCGQLTIARTVANAVGRASIRAEIELEFKVLIDNKDSEISRLHDKLKYYELVNHEMSQRNQEAMELARRRRQTHKKKQRWIWGSFAVSFAIGTTALAYAYIPWAQMKDRMPLVCSRFNFHRVASSST